MVKNKMASPTHSGAEVLKELIMCLFTGFKLSTMIQLNTSLANAYCYKKSIKSVYAIA